MRMHRGTSSAMTRSDRPSMAKSKLTHVTELLERRIANGDYARGGLPAERDLADECGVSRVTLRKALGELERRGLVDRPPNCRPRLKAVSKDFSTVEVAFLTPSLAPDSFSPDLQQWLSVSEHVARQHKARVRVQNYLHWDDPIITESLREFDGVFLVASSEPIPEWTSNLFANADGLVSLSEDWTDLGIPSVVLFPPRETFVLLDHLAEHGHKRVDCLNVQGHNAITEQRIDAWRDWCGERGLSDGQLFDHPCSAEENIFDWAMSAAESWLVSHRGDATAVHCVTLPAALGVVRAARAHGIQIGSDLSVCTIDNEGLGRYLSPSITSFERPNAAAFISNCLEWIQKGGGKRQWKHPLLYQPDSLHLVEGESSGPPPKKSKSSRS